MNFVLGNVTRSFSLMMVIGTRIFGTKWCSHKAEHYMTVLLSNRSFDGLWLLLLSESSLFIKKGLHVTMTSDFLPAYSLILLVESQQKWLQIVITWLWDPQQLELASGFLLHDHGGGVLPQSTMRKHCKSRKFKWSLNEWLLTEDHLWLRFSTVI